MFDSRRSFFARAGAGFAGLALIDLLSRDGYFAQPPRRPHHAAKAKHCVFLFMNGAPSQVDTFDHKPALTRFHDTAYRGDTPIGSNGRPVGNLMQTPFTFRKFGQSGLEISALFPHTARYADDLCVIRSLHTDTAAHASGSIQMNTGSVKGRCFALRERRCSISRRRPASVRARSANRSVCCRS